VARLPTARRSISRLRHPEVLFTGVEIEARDVGTLDVLPAARPANGPLAAPTARDLRINLRAVGSDQPDYFSSDEARFGPAATLEVRAPAQVEEPLFAGDLIDPARRTFLRVTG
jgi:hypothetical protein